MLEMGLADGASAIFWAELFDPAFYVGVDIAPRPRSDWLDDYVADEVSRSDWSRSGVSIKRMVPRCARSWPNTARRPLTWSSTMRRTSTRDQGELRSPVPSRAGRRDLRDRGLGLGTLAGVRVARPSLGVRGVTDTTRARVDRDDRNQSGAHHARRRARRPPDRPSRSGRDRRAVLVEPLDPATTAPRGDSPSHGSVRAGRRVPRSTLVVRRAERTRSLRHLAVRARSGLRAQADVRTGRTSHVRDIACPQAHELPSRTPACQRVGDS